jgi:starch phosphorylase
VELFRRLDRDLWEKTGHNPVLLLGTIEQVKLENAAKDDPFLAHLRRVESNLQTYLAGDSTWFRRTYAKSGGDEPCIAYFSAEFGLTECLSIFAGGSAYSLVIT